MHVSSPHDTISLRLPWLHYMTSEAIENLCRAFVFEKDITRSIYIKKNVCLFVRYAFPHRTTDFDESFQGWPLHPAKVDVYFVRKTTNPYGGYKHPMKLTNRIAAVQNVKGIDSDGGRKPSERILHCTTNFNKNFEASSSQTRTS